jgi:hypothetical protein
MALCQLRRRVGDREGSVAWLWASNCFCRGSRIPEDTCTEMNSTLRNGDGGLCKRKLGGARQKEVGDGNGDGGGGADDSAVAGNLLRPLGRAVVAVTTTLGCANLQGS